MASGVVSFMGVMKRLNVYPSWIIAYLSVIHCLSFVKGDLGGARRASKREIQRFLSDC